MPYLTPDTLPGSTRCRALLIPDEKTWLALVTGALSELTYEYNWEQFGTATPDETAQAFRDMLAAFEDCEVTTASLAIIEHRETSGVAGGTVLSGGLRQRTLNHEAYDPDNIVTLSANNFTLQPGTYRITARAVIWGTNESQMYLWNVPSSVIIAGSFEERHEHSSVWSHSVTHELVWAGTLANATALSIYHWVTTSMGTYGFGVPYGVLGYEVYARVVIEKVG